MKTLREIVIEWWSKIPTIEREQLWIAQPVVSGKGRFASSATGSEIEKIFLYLREDTTTYCFKFDKTVNAVDSIELLNRLFGADFSGYEKIYYTSNGSNFTYQNITLYREVSPTLFYAIMMTKTIDIPSQTTSPSSEWIKVVDNKIKKEHEGPPVWVYYQPKNNVEFVGNSNGLILSKGYTHYMPAQLPPLPPTIKEQICDMIANNKGNLEELADNIIKIFK